MTLLRLNPAQRRLSVVLLVLCAAFVTKIGVDAGEPGRVVWLICAIVLLGLAYAVLGAPSPAVDRDEEAPPPGRPVDVFERMARAEPTFAVPVGFSGDAVDVFAYLQHGEHMLGGHGLCTAVDHNAWATVEVQAPDADLARGAARLLVEEAGGIVTHVREATWVG